MYVQDIQEGENVDAVFLVDSAHLRYTKANKAYLKLVLTDNSGQIESVMWDETIEKNPDSRNLQAGDFIDISGRAAVNRFSKQVEIVLNQIRIVSPDDLDIVDFLPTTTQDIDGLKKELSDAIDQVSDGHLKKLVDKVFSDPDLMKAYCLAPAAKNYHHGYLGGLLEHSVSVAKLAILMCDHYGDLDKSLLVTGALLHDIGKIREFNYTNRIDYSTEGRLVGHIAIGDKIVVGYADSIKGLPESVKLSVSHLILSHHGEPEYGAVVKPKTKEAVVLNIIDNADAKVNGWLQIAKKYSDDVEWTDYQSMFGDFLYLGPPQKAAEKKEPQKPSKQKSEDTSTLF